MIKMSILRYLRYAWNILAKDKLQLLIFFVTSRCNSRCKTCFNWKNLNNKKDMSLDEIGRISSKMPYFPILLLSGGEPFLRKDLVELCTIFYLNNKVRSISIPTNGLLPEVIYSKSKEIIDKCPSLLLKIHLSLDGTENIHDSIRGVKGNFKKVEESARLLDGLKKEHPKSISVNITTTVYKENIGCLKELFEHVKKNMKVDSHGFEILRGTPKSKEVIGIDRKDFETYQKIAIESDNYYYSKIFNPLARWYILAKKDYFYDNQRKIVMGKKMDFPCAAGRSIAVLMEDGTAGLCELIKPIGNVHESGYDLIKALNSKKARAQKRYIRKTRCSCSHCVFLYQSIEHNLAVSLIKIPMSYLFRPKR